MDEVSFRRAAAVDLIRPGSDKKRLAAQRFDERLGFVASHRGMKKNP